MTEACLHYRPLTREAVRFSTMETDDGLGPNGRRVAANVRELRKARGLDLKDLSARLRDLGVSISLNALSRVENGKRRVDVDDLVALAVALDVSPIRLLLPAEADGQEVELTHARVVSAEAAWPWAAGSQPLPEGDDKVFNVNVNRLLRFQPENAPHVPRGWSFAEMEKHQDVLSPVWREARRALDAGIPELDLLAYIRIAARLRGLTPLRAAGVTIDDEVI